MHQHPVDGEGLNSCATLYADLVASSRQGSAEPDEGLGVPPDDEAAVARLFLLASTRFILGTLHSKSTAAAEMMSNTLCCDCTDRVLFTSSAMSCHLDSRQAFRWGEASSSWRQLASTKDVKGLCFSYSGSAPWIAQG